MVEFNKFTLANGLRIYSENVPSSQSFALGIGINAGSRDDFEGREGLAHFVEHAVFRRTKTRTSKKISLEFEQLGAYFNAFTTKEFTCFYVRALNSNFSKVFRILADIVFNPVFRSADVEKERNIILEEISSYEDDPEELIHDCGEELIFPSHRLGHPIAGKSETVKNISVDDLAKFHSTLFVPSNIVVSFTGSIPFEKVCNESNKILSGVASGQESSREVRQLLSLTQRKQEQRDFQQAHFYFGKVLPGAQSKERYTLAALNIILGDGMSSRLHQVMRESHSLVYSVYSSTAFHSDLGNISVYAGSDKGNQKKIIKLFYDELLKLYEKGISPRELDRAKQQLKSGAIMALENLSDRMQAIIKSLFTLGRYESIEETINEIDSLTMERVGFSILNHFNPEEWSELVFLP